MKTESSRLPIQDYTHFFETGRPGSHRIFIWGLLSTFFFIALYFFKPTLLQLLDFKNYDLLLKNYPNNFKSDRVVIVDLDEKSLRQYGQWPWPRYQVAELFNKIIAMEPAVIGLDMVFAEPDRTSVKRLLKDLGAAYQLNLAIDQFPDKLSDNDLILAETLTKGPFVLGNKFHFNRPEKNFEQCTLHPVKVLFMQSIGEHEENWGIPESTGVLCNLTILSEKVGASGFFNFSPDQDGMLRRLPLLIQYNGKYYTSLALAMVLKFKETDQILLKQNGGTLQTINYTGTSVPVDPHGQLLIKFRGPNRSYDYLSAADIIEGSVSSEQIQGRIAIVGTSAEGLKEFRTTPFDLIFPGAEVQATVVDNLLTGDFIAVPNWSNGMVLLLVLILGILLSLFVAFSGAASGFIIMVLFTVGLWLVTQQAFFRMGLFIGTAYPIASVICNYLFLTVLKYRLEEKKMFSGMRELLLTQDVTIESMANLAEYRDPETGGHIKRTRMYVRLLAEHIKRYDKYKHFLSDVNIDMLYKSTPLHDIGKVGIPDHILLKTGPLTEEEFEVMKTHTNIGRDVIESSLHKLGKKSFLTIAAEIAQSHQEKWDGTGYPQGLKGDEIPISGRLMALADVYDALISKRAYKPPFSHAMSVDIIKKGRGTHFDPDIVDAFLEIHEQFREIARKFADFQEEREALQEDTPSGDSVSDPYSFIARE
jgi:HD-GYP domain-containing protein (c-di-GMP phosphodiesterase class II)